MRKTIRILGVLLAAALLLFTASCSSVGASSKKAAASRLSDGFSCDATAVWNGRTYEVKIAREAPGLCTMTFVKPSELSSLSFTLGSDGLTITFGSRRMAVDPSSVAQSALFNAVTSAFDVCASPGGLKMKMSGGRYVITAGSKSGNFILTLNKQLVPQTLRFPAQKLNITFKNFAYTCPPASASFRRTAPDCGNFDIFYPFCITFGGKEPFYRQNPIPVRFYNFTGFFMDQSSQDSLWGLRAIAIKMSCPLRAGGPALFL